VKQKKRQTAVTFRKTVLRNGLTIVTERQPIYRSLSMGVWVKVGTRNERTVEAGASHFLEHMLFKGTDKREPLDIALEIDQVGGEFNAFTSREHTCFHLLLLDRDMELGADMLTDIVLNSRFDGEEFERERKVIQQEISMVEENPEELAHDIYYELLYGKHGLGKPILGTDTSMRRIRRGDVLRYFSRYYRPEHLIVSVSGNVSHAAVVRAFRALARRDWPGRPAERPMKFRQDPAPKTKHGMWWIKRRSEQVHLIWGVPGPKYADRDRFAAYLLNIFLGGGMSSTLFQEIREKKGLAYTVYSSLESFVDSGMFTIYAACAMNQVPLCLKLIEECVGKLRRELLTEDELEVIKNNLKGTILLNSDSVEARMSSIAKNEIYFGRYVDVNEVCAMIDAVRPADIRRVARKLLARPERAVLALGPRPTPTVRAKLKPHFPSRFQR